MAITKTSGVSKSSKQNIKVCVRVRPLLATERYREEVIYYPEDQGNSISQSVDDHNTVRKKIIKILISQSILGHKSG
jgi:hypothetical protein